MEDQKCILFVCACYLSMKWKDLVYTFILGVSNTHSLLLNLECFLLFPIKPELAIWRRAYFLEHIHLHCKCPNTWVRLTVPQIFWVCTVFHGQRGAACLWSMFMKKRIQNMYLCKHEMCLRMDSLNKNVLKTLVRFNKINIKILKVTH